MGSWLFCLVIFANTNKAVTIKYFTLGEEIYKIALAFIEHKIIYLNQGKGK